MSKDIVIQQKGVDVDLDGVEVIKTKGLTAGRVKWYPEDECTLGTAELTANGVYTAAALGVYAISQATVAVPEGSQAVGSGEDGKYYKVTVVSGEFVYTEVPKTIAVTTEPETTTYHPGQTIDYTGLVVTMYKADGTVYEDTSYPYGAVPLSEIIRPTQKAEAGMEAVTVYWICPQSGQVLAADVEITVEES